MTSTTSHSSKDSKTSLKRALIVVFWLAVWQLASMLVANQILLAGPYETLVALAGLITTSTFWATIGTSFAHIAGGFLLAYVSALILGGAGWHFKILRDFLQPLVLVFKSVPVACLVVILLIWFGSSGVSGVVVALVVFPPVYFSMLEAGDNLNRKLDQMLRVSGVGRLRRGLAFYWPSSLPFLLATSRVVVGMSWKAGVAAELIGISMGSIGEAVYQSKLQLNTADLFAWTLVIVLLAYACEKIFLWILSSSSKHTLAWALPKRPNRAPSERSHFEQTENSDDSEKTNLSAAPTKNIGHTDSSVGRICFSHVSFFYIEGKRILTNFSLDIAPQSRICLTNPSGAGKTTVLSLMAGLVRPQEGKISRDGSLAMMFQDTRLLEYATARENVALVAGEYRSSDYIDTLLRSLLDGVDLNCAVENLSGGERRRVELARTLALPADIVLLDEPFTGLDEANRKRAAKVILAQASGTLVVASHDRDSLENLQAQELRM